MAEPARSFGLDRQTAIYLSGLGGQLPALPLSAEALELAAKEVMKPEAYAYVAGGAGGEDTMRANLEAFRRWRIVPRMLRDVERRDLSVQLLGMTLPTPLLLAPVGVQSIVHPDAEIAAVKGAKALGIPAVLSTASSKNARVCG